MSLESQLMTWHALWEKKKHLDRFIPLQEERLRLLKDRISTSGILSSIIQQTENMDMPRGSDTSDKIGNLVSNVLDKSKELEVQITVNKADLLLIETELETIETEISQFSERHQIVLTAYYRDQFFWKIICDKMNIEKSRMYDMIDECIHPPKLLHAVE